MIIALIPARSGSKRVPNKNIRMLDGIPLLAHSVVTAKHCGMIDNVFLSTDSDEYAAIGRAFGAEIIRRSHIFSTDDATDLSVVYDALAGLDATYNIRPPEYIVYLRPTTPIRTTGMIDEAIKAIVAAGDSVDSLRSVHEDSESVYKHMWIQQGFLRHLHGADFESTGLPNQMHPKTYHGNGYVDIVKPASIAKNGVLWGRCMSHITPYTPEIDTEEDWDRIEFDLKYGYHRRQKTWDHPT